MEKLLEDAGMEKAKEAARTCKELGSGCTIAKDVKPADRRLLNDAAEDKKMRLGQVMMDADGETMEGKTPDKTKEQKVARKVAKALIKDAVADCVDAGVAPTDMAACVKKDGGDYAELVRGDNKNADKDLKDALEEDALEKVIDCTGTAAVCKKEFKDRMAKTTTKVVTDADLDAEIKDAAWKKASELVERKENVGVMTKTEEKAARDTVKDTLKKALVPEREIGVVMKDAVTLEAIKEGADYAKTGTKTDVEIETKMKSVMDASKDANDFTPKLKASMLKAAKAMKEGGTKGELKQKPTGLVQIRECLTSDTKTITEAEIKSLVSADAKAVAVADVSKAVVIEKPVKDATTKRSCVTVAYPPKADKTEAEVKTEFANIVKARRRALGRKLSGDEYTTSSGDVNEVVDGDTSMDKPADDNTPEEPTAPAPVAGPTTPVAGPTVEDDGKTSMGSSSVRTTAVASFAACAFALALMM
jgi:hypothetical protein